MKPEALILDMDGVLWRADQPVGDLAQTFAAIERRGFKVILATNNSTRTPQQYQEKLAGFGVQLERWQIINSSQATAQIFRHRCPDGGPVYIIGEVGLVEAMTEQGFFHAEENVLAVVTGMDRGLNYEKLSQATLLIRAGAPFIATNSDRTYPTPRGLVPGAGAILAALETATDTPPEVIGKPSPIMYQVALERLALPPEAVLVVGDRLETDIAGAQAIGCPTALVLSGVATETEALAWSPRPDWIAPDLASLVELL